MTIYTYSIISYCSGEKQPRPPGFHGPLYIRQLPQRAWATYKILVFSVLQQSVSPSLQTAELLNKYCAAGRSMLTLFDCAHTYNNRRLSIQQYRLYDKLLWYNNLISEMISSRKQSLESVDRRYI